MSRQKLSWSLKIHCFGSKNSVSGQQTLVWGLKTFFFFGRKTLVRGLKNIVTGGCLTKLMEFIKFMKFIKFIKLINFIEFMKYIKFIIFIEFIRFIKFIKKKTPMV